MHVPSSIAPEGLGNVLHSMGTCVVPMRVLSHNGKKEIYLVIGLLSTAIFQAQVISVRTDRGTVLYDSIFHYWADACYGYRIAILQILIQSSYPLMEKDLAFNHLINELQFVLGARGIVCSVINLEPFVLEENERLKRTFSNHDISCRCGARLNCCDQFFPPSLSYVTIATKDHAVATASAQNDNGSLEAESIVRAASTSVRFRLSKRVPVQVFEEWKSDVQCLLLLK
ncbi:hypothetical protein Tco_0246391 [Tanacetum coccineum]|uniref:Uncharacterized protein n=1 Tax=Tanacetum coccineum TaxID=301880 RepID=A0ABQ5B0Z5_9ASTR